MTGGKNHINGLRAAVAAPDKIGAPTPMSTDLTDYADSGFPPLGVHYGYR
ncbi:hypothetical protein ACIP5Y_00430 [Nocardia sp. NPDC088792]